MARTTESPRTSSDAGFNSNPARNIVSMITQIEQARTAFPLPPSRQGAKAGDRGSLFSRLAAVAAGSKRQLRTCISEWRRRARSRRDLMALGERELSDIHLTRCDAVYEASKPFWKE
jgi:uncharacterized protein YjiS (DUF1127 family)